MLLPNRRTRGAMHMKLVEARIMKTMTRDERITGLNCLHGYGNAILATRIVFFAD